MEKYDELLFLVKTAKTLGHCVTEDYNYCVHEHFPTPRRPRHQGPLDFSNFSGVETKRFVRKIYDNFSVFYVILTCYCQLATVYGYPRFMGQQLRDFVEKTKDLVSRFTTSHARIPGI